ncbi:N-acetyltransferase [Acinetobacter sp. ANC 5414]|uniref:N-acetyltransferase n=1 Tax=Acinetobacter sp. ANC 5414 TaxID=2731251 RepID=UPI00148F53B7|nr:N-acetyltransferase [Acinetobacter sp. ANC 5414]NNH00071.1 N-acetyltransferase [Acinetobacter sp. ANC 5414]
MTIHHTAIISPKAKIGANVEVGPSTIIYDNVEIGDNTVIGAFCEIGVVNHLSQGLPLIIGKNSNIRSHSIFYEGSTFEEGLTTGHRVTVRELVKAGKNLQIGTLSDLQGHCEIGDYVRFHSNVHIGQHSKIGNFVWIFPYVVLTNDPHPPSNTMLGVTVEDYALIATMSVILPGAVIAEGCLIGAHSSVKGKTEKHSIYVGSPAKNVGPTSRIKLEDGSDAYPWTKHFKRGYPEDVIKNW